jgi:F0F1-type ATP synthase membrane subunit b/b'
MKTILTLVIAVAAVLLLWITVVKPTQELIKSNSQRIERAVNTAK